MKEAIQQMDTRIYSGFENKLQDESEGTGKISCEKGIS